jgi:BirA family biotin operon repressor/biotin-[acetyl-CoA-carboxylase] ligase
MLKDAAPDYVSGARIGRDFQVSRAAVWKHIEELRQEGYLIEACSRRGYRMLPSEEKLNAWEISNNLGTSVIGSEIQYFESLDSTNRYAGRLASEGCRDGLTVIAGAQTEGRGRIGRNWESPAGMGIYLSVVLRPPMDPFETPILTLAAAVATVNALRKAAGVEAGIKWPNDLILDGKKVCGILLEMSSEADRVNHVIIGIGINYAQRREDFPEELRGRAISLKMAEAEGITENRTFGRITVIQEVLRELDSAFKRILEGDGGKILDSWRAHSVTLGREIVFHLKGVEYCGTAVDISEDGRLVVDCRDGIRRDLVSGEISIRGINGYAGG